MTGVFAVQGLLKWSKLFIYFEYLPRFPPSFPFGCTKGNCSLLYAMLYCESVADVICNILTQDGRLMMNISEQRLCVLDILPCRQGILGQSVAQV